jgi:hypothetical protein
MRYVLILLAAAAPASAFMWGASVGGGFGTPVGDYGEFAGASAVLDGRAIFCVTPSLNVTAGTAYRLGHKAKDFAGAEDAEYKVIPVLVGVNYRLEYLPLMPYFGGGGAVALCQATVPMENGTEDLEATRLGAYVEGGTEYYLSETFGVDVRGRFMSTFGGEKTLYEDMPVDADNYFAFDAVIGLFFYP